MRDRRHTRLPRLAGSVVLVVALSGAVVARAEPVTVRFPPGDCDSGWIEVQVFDRTTDAWLAHPTHPRVKAGQCLVEESGTLLNEIRVRCIDPSGRRPASIWVVGANVWKPIDGESCNKP